VPSLRPRPSIAVAAALLLWACADASTERVRVVLVTLDTLRHDSLERDMPALAEWARRGLVFEQFYASTSSTQPTHASMFTGRHPWQHGVSRNGVVLTEDADTLAERLSAAGFSTAAVVASFPLHRRFGFRQGFDSYVDEFTRTQQNKETWNDEPVEGSLFFSPAEDVNAAAFRALDAADGDQQFFWFHYFDPHAPYGDSRAGDSRADEVINLSDLNGRARSGRPVAPLLARARALYDADVAHLDRALDELLERLEREAGDGETHVLVTSDHGESFGEDGSFGHGKRVSRPQVHVPTVLLSPRVRPGVTAEPAGSVDVFATVLALAGLPHDDAGGRDLSTPASVEPAALGMRRTFAEPTAELRIDGRLVPLTGQRFFFVDGGVLYLGDASGVFTESDETDADPALLSSLPAVFAGFEAELAGRPVDELLDEETRRALEALGYTR